MSYTASEIANLKDEFFRLRAVEGKSFREIEAEIGVTKKTLCSWAKDYKLQIQMVKDFKSEELAKKYRFTEIEKNKILGELHTRLVEELQNRDLSELPTDKLVATLISVQAKLHEPVEVHTGETVSTLDDYDVLKPEVVSI